MAKNIDFMGATFPDVPSIRLPQHEGGLVSFDDTSDGDIQPADVAQGKIGYAQGQRVVGTATPSTPTIQSLSVTQNGTYTAPSWVDGYSPVTVNVSGGGGGSWTLLASTTVSVNQSGSGLRSITTINIGDKWTSNAHYMIYVRVRDTVGKRQGYFWGSDNFYWNPGKANNPSTTNPIGGVSVGIWVLYNNSGKYSTYSTHGGAASKYGVFVSEITQDGIATIATQYVQSQTGTINSTYSVEIYFLDYPDGVGIYDAT